MNVFENIDMVRSVYERTNLTIICTIYLKRLSPAIILYKNLKKFRTIKKYALF